MADPTRVGDAAEGVDKSGKMPVVAYYFDQNGNGIPDWLEPEQLEKALAAAAEAVAPFLPAPAGAGIALGISIAQGVVTMVQGGK